MLDGLSVLLAEDNATNQLVVAGMLRALGAQPAIAPDGIAALERASRQPFDVLLIDIEMPRLSGRELMARLREGEGPNRDAPIIVLTAHGPVTSHGEAVSAGADGLIAKPLVSVESFGVQVRSILERALAAGRRATLDTAPAPASQPNGVHPGGVHPSGGHLNGAAINGAHVNGAPLNGAYVNGVSGMNGTNGTNGHRAAADAADHDVIDAGPRFDPAPLSALVGLSGGARVAILIDRAVSEIDAAVADLERARGAADVEALRRAAHALAGMAGSVGAVALTTLAREVDEAPEATLQRADTIQRVVPQLWAHARGEMIRMAAGLR